MKGWLLFPILLIIVVLSASSVSSVIDWNADTIVFYGADNNGTHIMDESPNGYHASIITGGMTANVSGNYTLTDGSGYLRLVKVDQLVNIGDAGNNEYTWGGWIFNLAPDGVRIMQDPTKLSFGSWRADNVGDRLRVNLFDGANDKNWFSGDGTDNYDDQWHHFAISRKDTNVTIYVDGVSQSSSLQAMGDTSLASNISILADTVGTNRLENTGRFWGLFILNKSITAAEASALNSSGRFDPFFAAPVTPSPLWLNFSTYNDSLQSESELNLFLNITDSDSPLVNFTILDNGTINITVLNFNTTIQFIYNISAERRYLLQINATDESGNNGLSRTLDVIIDRTNGTVATVTDKDSPPFAFVGEPVNVTTSCSDLNLFACARNISLNGVEVNYTEVIGINDTTQDISELINFTTPGTYDIFSQVSDDHTKNFIEDYTVSRYPGKIMFNNEVTIEVISLEQNKPNPTETKKSDRYNIDFKLDPGVHRYRMMSDLPITYRKISNVKAHLVIGDGLGKYWYDMENTDSAKVNFIEQGANYIVFETTASSFNSIGGVNIVNETTQLIVRPEKGDPIRMANINYSDQVLSAKDVWVSLGIVQFNATRQEDAHLLGTWHVDKSIGVQPITGFWRIVVDGVEVANISRSLNAIDHESIGLFTQVDNVTIGLHNVSFEHRKEHIGGGAANPMSTHGINWVALQPRGNTTTMSNTHQRFEGASIDDNLFSPIINLTHNSNFASEMFIAGTFEITPTAISNTTLILQLNGIDGCNFQTTHSTAASIAVITANCMFNYTSASVNNLSILAKIDAGTATVNADIIMYTMGVNQTLSNNFNSTLLQSNTSITINSTTPVLIDSLPITITTINGTAFVIATSTVTDTNNVANLMITADDLDNHSTDKLMVSGAIGNLAILNVMTDLSLGTHDINLYGWGNTATPINYINYSISIFEGINIEGTQITTTPVINITFPINNSNISTSFITGTCADVAGVSSVTSSNTTWLFNESGSTLSWRFDYNSTFSSNQTLITEISCINPFGNTANQTIQWNFIFTPPDVQVDFLSVTECPSTTSEGILFGLFILLALFFIYLAMRFAVGVLGFFGSILLMILSWNISSCLSFYGYVLGLFSIFLLIYFAVAKLGFENKTFGS